MAPGKPFALNDSISLVDLNFTYEGKTVPALNHISLNIKKGEIIGITGRTGSGKSTLAQLIAGMYYANEDSNHILIDGISLREIDLHDFRKHLAYVPQDVFLFSETIRDNIAFGIENGEISDAELNIAVEAASLHRDIPQWPDGLSTMLGERGVSLSGGQKQRVALARALVKKAELYVLDDCLSAVDAETERHIIDHLTRWLRNSTALIVSHRIAPLRMAQRIVVLDDGEILDVGTHEELLERCEYYRNLNDSQSAELQ
jgi:ATP-binding cassette subfamily B protein